MKNAISLLTLLLAVSLTGCGNSPSTQSSPATTRPAASTPTTKTEVAYALGSKKKGDKGVCVVCNVKEGTTEEEAVVETLDYKGKTYIFCDEAEKADFIAEPGKFVR